VTDVWTKFIEGNTSILTDYNHNSYYNILDQEELADIDDTLDLDNDGYPRLPEDVLSLRLSRKKSILRQFMCSVRRMSH